MGKKPISFDDKNDDFKKQIAASEELESTNDTKSRNKKPNTDFIRLDLKPRGGYDLLAYCNKRCGDLGQLEGKRVTTTAFIQRLIVKDMEEQNGRKKLSKREMSVEKIVAKLEQLDDKQISALETIISTM